MKKKNVFYIGIFIVIILFIVFKGVQEELLHEQQNEIYNSTLETIESYNEQLVSIGEMIEVMSNDQKALANKFDDMVLERMNNVMINSSDLTIPSNILVGEVEAVLADTELIHLSQAFVDAEQRYNVNAFLLMGIASWESDYGRSVRGKRDNNFTGMGVYSEDAEGFSYESGYENILDTARLLSENYLNPEGPYYKGTSIEAISKSYCIPSEPWAEGVTSISEMYEEKYRELFIYK